MRRHRLIAILFTVAGALTGAAVHAEWPDRPVRLVVPFPAGGPTDAVARTVARHVEGTLRAAVVVENKPGADGAIAAQAVAAAPPDGNTLLFATSSVVALPLLRKSAAFRGSDFAPVASVGQFAFGMFAHPGVASGSMDDFISHARAHPGSLNYACANATEQMAATHFLRAAGLDMVRVPYKGAAQAMPDLLAGRVQVYFAPLAAGLQHARDGKLVLLATFLPRRTALAPDVPTLAEAGLPGVSVQSWQMILAPARTPRAVIERMSAAVNAALADAAVRKQLEELGVSVKGSSPEELARILDQGSREWSAIAPELALAQ